MAVNQIVADPTDSTYSTVYANVVMLPEYVYITSSTIWRKKVH